MIRDSEHSGLHKSVDIEMAYAGLSISLRTTLSWPVSTQCVQVVQGKCP
jgi:hypothetical protein